MTNYILLLFPIAIIIILFAGCSVNIRYNFNNQVLSINQAKAMQAVAALMIILHHMVQTITKYGDKPKGPITEWNSFGILFTSVFFFFSGFGLYKSYLQKEDYLKGFLGKRLPKLLVPFLVTNILYLITVSSERIVTTRHIFTSILGITLMNTNAWFLIEIIILYIAFYICFKKAESEAVAFRNLTIITFILVILSLLLCHDSSRVNGHWFMGEWWYNTTLIFVLGMLFARKEKQIFDFSTRKYNMLLPTFLVVFVAFYIFEEYILDNVGYYQEWSYHPGYPEKFITLIVQVILCAIFMYVLYLINLKVEFKNKVLSFLGGISFEIYLIHDIFRQALYRENKMPDWEYFLLVFVFTVLFAWLLSYIDNFLLDFYKENSKIFLSFKRVTYDDSLTYEAKAKLRRRAKIIYAVKFFYLTVFVLMMVTSALNLYDITIGNSKRFDLEVSNLAKANISDTVTFGKWTLDYQKGKEEPISWTVYDKTDNHLLLVCNMVLSNSSYHDKHLPVSWKESKLCRQLNHDFYKYAFTKSERKLLSGRINEADPDWYCSERDAFNYYINKDGEEDFEDVVVNNELVFVLSKDEVLKYMPNKEDRIIKASEAAKDQGIGTINSNYKAPWWIQDEGIEEMRAMYIEIDGSIDERGKVINNTGMGVRPALWIKLPAK